MFNEKNKKQLRAQVEVVNESKEKSHKKKLLVPNRDFDKSEQELKVEKGSEFKDYIKEFKEVILIKKAFGEELRKNIDFDLTFFKELKRKQPKLFGYLSSMPAHKQAIEKAFFRAVKFDISSLREDIKEVFSIPESIKKTPAYESALKAAFLWHLHNMNYKNVERLTIDPNIPVGILSDLTIQAGIKNWEQMLLSVATDPKDPDRKSLKVIKKYFSIK